jgi:hypothetical protein
LEETDVGKSTFVNRDWMGPAAAGVVVLTGLLSHPGQAASIIVVAVATCFWWSARGRWLTGRVGLSEQRRRSRLRHAFAGQAACVLAAWGALVLIDEVVAAGAVLLVGVCLSALAWPWPWRLDQAAEDRSRTHDPSLATQHLGAAGVLAALALGAVVALNAVAASMLTALVVGSLVDAWNERRRPHTAPPPTADIAPQVVEVAAPEPRLEQTVEYTPVFEPLDIPVAPLRPTRDPDPSRYVLFADEVVPSIEPRVEPLAAEQRPSYAEQPVEWSTQVLAADVHEPVAERPADEWWNTSQTDPPLPAGLPSSSAENVVSQARSAQQMWEDARRRAEEWTGGRSVEQPAERSATPEPMPTPEPEPMVPAPAPDSLTPPPVPDLLASDRWIPSQPPAGRRRAARSAAESSMPAAAGWGPVEPGLGRRRAERLEEPSMDESDSARRSEGRWDAGQRSAELWDEVRKETGPYTADRTDAEPEPASQPWSGVQPGLGRRIAERSDAEVFPEPRSPDPVSRGTHAAHRGGRPAEKYAGRRVAARP